MVNKEIQSIYEFASFRLDIIKRRLTFGVERVSLTPREFDVLLYLIENAERVVEKDELLDAVWKDTFVEEGTLTRNISWLRKKLAAHIKDDTKIIETLPKRGYRFLPEITRTGENLLYVEEQIVHHIQIEEIIEIEPTASDNEMVIVQPEVSERQFGAISADNIKALPAASASRYFSLFYVLIASLFLGAIVFLAYREYFAQKQTKVFLASKIVPFSGLPGRENSPAFSPDGKQMVFSWDGGIEGNNSDIYVKLIGAGEPVRLTDNAADEIKPVFSPDGKSIAFVRVFPTHNEIILISALGGAERKIYDHASYASVSFSPDGKFLATANLDLSQNEAGIFTINLQSGEKVRLTTPAAPVVDHTPRFSPDGKNLAFIRYFSSFRREIFVVPAIGGEPRQITSDGVRIYGLTWNIDSQSLFFSSFRQVNQLNLWHIFLDGNSAPQMISTGSKNLQDLAISPDGRTIAFVEEAADENIWEIGSNQASRPFIRSTRADHSQQFSPDGSQIVFASDRTGNYEIWLADADGKNQRQLTDSNLSAGSPRFSPDGKFIAYDAQTAEGSDIFIISVNGGATRRLTKDGKSDSLPAWSIDGNWVFFLSNRSGTEQIWKISAAGDEAGQVTKHGAFEMFAAPDGKKIIYSKGVGKAGLWSVGTDGTDEKPIAELADAGAWRSWSVTSNGVFYTASTLQIPFNIKFYDFTTGQTRKVSAINKSPLSYYPNLAVSADGRKMLYAQQDQTSASIILAELAK